MQKTAKIIIEVLVLFVLLGKTTMLVNGILNVLGFVRNYSNLSTEYMPSFAPSVLQYFSFLGSTLLVPDYTVLDTIEKLAYYPDYTLGFIALQPDINPLYVFAGIITLVLVIISSVVCRHNHLSNISCYWVIISFLLLGVIGLGAPLNQMYLYANYFSWAIYISVLMLCHKIFKNRSIFKWILVCLLITISFAGLASFFDMAMKVSPFFSGISTLQLF